MSTQARSAGSVSRSCSRSPASAASAAPPGRRSPLARERRGAGAGRSAGRPPSQPPARDRAPAANRSSPARNAGSSTAAGGACVTHTLTDASPSTASPNARVSCHTAQVAVDVVEGVGLEPHRRRAPREPRTGPRAGQARARARRAPAASASGRTSAGSDLGERVDPGAGDARAPAGSGRAACDCSAG